VVSAVRASALTRRHLAAVALCALVVAGATACSHATSSGHGAGATTSTSSTLVAPWQGTLTTSGLPAGVQTLRAVSCATTQRCWAVGSTVATATAGSGPALVTSSDGGVTWRTETVPAGVGYLADIACASSRTCTAVGQAGATGVGPGAIITTTNGGAAWVSRTVPAGTTDVTALSCPHRGGCVALGTVSGRVTTLSPDGPAGAWTASGLLPPAATVATSLACTDGLHCWATASDPSDLSHAAGSIDASTDGGTTWVPQTVPAGVGAINAVDCRASATPKTPVSCTAVGTTSTVLNSARTGQAVVLGSGGNGTWASEPAPAGAADLLDVSCSAGPCLAVGTAVATAAEGGTVVLTTSTGSSASVWRRAAVVAVALPLTGVSCVSTAACVVVGESVSARIAAA